MNGNILYTKNLGVGYGGKILIDNIEIELKQGQIVTLIGPNGAGKSTVLKSIIRQLDIISGSVFIDGQSVTETSFRDLSQKMSALMTERISPELMTCGDIVRMGRYPYTGQFGILSETDKTKVTEAMELCSVTEFSDRYFDRISDGQRQRVMLARAICQEPRVMVLDEPTSFLDIRHKIQMLNILKKLVREKGTAVIMSMHEIDFAQRISDYVICVGKKGIDRTGAPDEIFMSGYISKLYGISEGSFDENSGTAELEAPQGVPQVFVIAGGGAGIKTFRQLQRQNTSFAAGVLHENDIDYPTAKELAAEVISEKAFEPISDSAVTKAIEKIDQCRKVICCVNSFGTMNDGNRKLLEYAEKKGYLD